MTIGLGFHPDTSFAEYQNEDGSSSFTGEDSSRYDALMVRDNPEEPGAVIVEKAMSPIPKPR